MVRQAGAPRPSASAMWRRPPRRQRVTGEGPQNLIYLRKSTTVIKSCRTYSAKNLIKAVF